MHCLCGMQMCSERQRIFAILGNMELRRSQLISVAASPASHWLILCCIVVSDKGVLFDVSPIQWGEATLVLEFV